MTNERSHYDEVAHLPALKEQQTRAHPGNIVELENDLRTFTQQQLQATKESFQGWVESSYEDFYQ